MMAAGRPPACSRDHAPQRRRSHAPTHSASGPGEAGRIGKRGEVKPGGKRPDGLFPGDVGERQHAGRLAVKAAREADDVGALGVRARQTDGGFDRLGAAAEELDASEVAGRQLGDEPHQLGARLRREAADGDRVRAALSARRRSADARGRGSRPTRPHSDRGSRCRRNRSASRRGRARSPAPTAARSSAAPER